MSDASGKPAASPRHVPLVATIRGEQLECVHYGSVAVVDHAGTVRYRVGDPDALVYTRSTLKPLQALPLLGAGGLEHFGLALRELAVMCASHNGEATHVEAVQRILAAAGCREDDLRCGSHVPMFYTANAKLPPHGGEGFTSLHHNCSGKHAGMLAHCRLLGAPTEGYRDPDHPVQQAIRAAVAAFAGVAPATLVRGPDGCTAPNYALPLTALARSYARLAARDRDPVFADAPARLFAAMAQHPLMVSGTGRQDLAISEAGRGDWVSKFGAEGVQVIGIRSRGIGIAIKIADGDKGDTPRALVPTLIEVLRQLGVIETVPEPIQRYDAHAVRTQEWRMQLTLQPMFALEPA